MKGSGISWYRNTCRSPGGSRREPHVPVWSSSTCSPLANPQHLPRAGGSPVLPKELNH